MAHSAKTSSTSEDEASVYPPLPGSVSSEESDSDLLADRIAARGAQEDEAPSRPITPPRATETPDVPDPPQNTTPIIFKAHRNSFSNVALEKPVKMTKSQIRVALSRELRGSVFNDIEDLVDNVFHGQDIPWNDIWQEQLTRTVKKNGRKVVIEEKSYDNATRKWKNWPATNTKSTEIELGEHLNAVAEIVRQRLGRVATQDDLIYTARFAVCGRGTETAATNVRKPDLIGLARVLKDAEVVTWAHFKVLVSLKIGTGDITQERMQLAEYARLIFYAQPDRRYVLGLGFRDTKLNLYVFDRAGILVSRVYDVHEEPEQFLRIAIGVLFLDHQSLGYDTSFFTEDNKRFVTLGSSTYKISGDLFLDMTIRGRGTVCLKARGTGRDRSEVYVVKDAWVDRSRAKNEVEILKILKERKVQNVPSVILDGIVQVKDLNTGEHMDDNTDIFRGDPVFNVEIRDHHRIVMQPYGEPITRFSSLLELMHAMLDILQTIIDLDKAGILHRDISLGNLVLVPDPNSKFRKGFIIDFDHAIEKNRKGKGIAEAERTGTLPYIAIDILELCVDHGADHDAESLLYVLIWITFSQAGPNGEARKLPFEEWDKTVLRAWSPPGDLTPSSLSTLAAAKGFMMTNEPVFKDSITNKMYHFFHPLRMCLLQARRALFPQPELLPLEYESLNADPSDTSAIRRDKDTVLRGMKDAFEASIKHLEKSHPAEVPPEPKHRGPIGSGTATQANAGDAPKAGRRPQYAADHMPTHHMKLRNRLTEEKVPEADTTPEVQAPVAEKKRSLLIQALQTSHRESQASSKRSRTAEDDQVGEAVSAGSSAKKLKASTESQVTNRPTKSMSSAKNKDKAATTDSTTGSSSSADKNLG